MSKKIKIVEREISELIAAEYNPRKLNEDQHSDLMDSLNLFGMVEPLIVNTHKDRKDIIIGGHQRLIIWKELGHTTVSTVETKLTLEKEKELNIRLNKNTGSFDTILLDEHFTEDELLKWGFQDFELEFEPQVDYAALDDDGDSDIIDKTDDMRRGVKKAIQIEFESGNYEEAKELVKFWREKEADIGSLLIEKLKEEKDKIED